MKIMKTVIILLLSAFSLSVLNSQEELCTDYLLLDGYEPLERYGMDSTYNWWAVTAPFSSKKRLTVNGAETDVYDEITNPVFSYDGLKWAAFVNNNGTWEIVTESGKLDVMATAPGELVYSGISNELVYSYFESEVEYIHTKNKTFQVMNRVGKLYPGLYAQKVAFTGYQGDRLIMNINGKQIMDYDAVHPIGFWTDGSFLYAGRSGNGWEVYQDEKSISQMYSNISEVTINRYGTVAAAVCATYTKHSVAIMIAEEYYEPVISDNFDSIRNIVLHPEAPMMAFAASKMLANYVVLNTVKYEGGEYMGIPYFSYDGSELYYVGCDAIDCFISINGKKMPIYSQFGLEQYFAVAPDTETMAYSSGSTMMLKKIGTNNLHAGMMTDEMGPPRYNWRDGRYEAMGAIRDRLYMLTCIPE